MIVFDGYARAQLKEERLATAVAELKQRGIQPHVAAILFTEDKGSQLYTRLKSEAAARVGVEYEVYSFSLADDVKTIQSKLAELNQNPKITGIIIQKPSKRVWLNARSIEKPSAADNEAWQAWWASLVTQIDLKKDVDGLHPQTLAAIEAGTWETDGLVMPATAKAVLEILALAAQEVMHVPVAEKDFAGARQAFLHNKKVLVIGKSDIVGKPVFYALQAKGCQVEMLGTAEIDFRIDHNLYLLDADVIISSTGHAYLINDAMIKDKMILIDVGEPYPDIDQTSVEEKTLFLTPVPGGVGPMTVICLLENAVQLLS